MGAVRAGYDDPAGGTPADLRLRPTGTGPLEPAPPPGLMRFKVGRCWSCSPEAFGVRLGPGNRACRCREFRPPELQGSMGRESQTGHFYLGAKRISLLGVDTQDVGCSACPRAAGASPCQQGPVREHAVDGAERSFIIESARVLLLHGWPARSPASASPRTACAGRRATPCPRRTRSRCWAEAGSQCAARPPGAFASCCGCAGAAGRGSTR